MRFESQSHKMGPLLFYSPRDPPSMASSHYFRILGLLLLLLDVLIQRIDASRVETLPGFEGKLPFKFETGYVGVGEDNDVQLFYYFFESERNPRKGPLVLWLTGGPGCSGLSSILYEIGPITFNYQDYDPGNLPTLLINPFSWTKLASIIFIDAPVGAGFSYSRNPEYYNVTDTMAAAQNYEFIRKWLWEHPEFMSNPFFVAGDSYGGKMTPMVVQLILNGIHNGELPVIKIQGFFIGNPITDEDADKNSRVEYAYRVGLLSTELYQSVKESCNGFYYNNVNTSNVKCVDDMKIVTECLSNINILAILEPNCPSILLPSKPKESGRRLITEEFYGDLSLSLPRLTPELWCRIDNYVLSYVWANDKDVQEALHVRKGTRLSWARCNQTLLYTKDVSSAVSFQMNLSRNALDALVYSGDQDMSVSYLGTLRWIGLLDLTVESEWRPWFVDGQVAGFTMKYENFPYYLTYTTIKGAGHTAPEYKPKECFALVERWFAHYDL